MKHLYLLVILISLFSTNGFSQHANIRSEIKSDIKKTEDGYSKAKLWYNLALEYFYINKDSAQICFTKAEQLIEENYKIDKFQVNFYQGYAGFYSEISEYQKSDSLYRKAINYAQEHNFEPTYYYLSCKQSIAMNQYTSGNFPNAKSLLNELEPEFIKLDTTTLRNKRFLSSFYANKAIIHANMNDLETALKLFKSNYALLKSLIDKNDILSIQSVTNAGKNLAMCYSMLDMPLEAISINQEIIKYGDDYNLQILTQRAYQNIASLYSAQNKYKEAVYNENLAIGENDEINALAFNNLGYYNLELGNYDTSFENLTKAKQLFSKLNNKDGVARNNRGFGQYYYELKKYSKAKAYFYKAKDTFKQLERNQLYYETLEMLGRCQLKLNDINKAGKNFKTVESYLEQEDFKIGYIKVQNKENLYSFYKAKSDYQNALKWHESFFELQTAWDSTYMNKDYQELIVLHETQQKENKILRQDNLLKQKDLDIKSNQLNTNLALSGTGMLVLLGFAYFQRHKRNEKYKLLKEKVQAKEDTQIQIGRELHDGVASGLLKTIHETDDPTLSHKLLQSYNEIRSLSHQLHNTPMHGEPFIERIIDTIPENTDNKTFKLSLKPNYMEIPQPYDSHVYRIIQELIANNIRHSNASQTSITLTLNNQILTLKYTDNGNSIIQKEGIGINNIRERVALMKGSMIINTDNGYSVDINININ